MRVGSNDGQSLTASSPIERCDSCLSIKELLRGRSRNYPTISSWVRRPELPAEVVISSLRRARAPWRSTKIDVTYAPIVNLCGHSDVQAVLQAELILRHHLEVDRWVGLRFHVTPHSCGSHRVPLAPATRFGRSLSVRAVNNDAAKLAHDVQAVLAQSHKHILPGHTSVNA